MVPSGLRRILFVCRRLQKLEPQFRDGLEDGKNYVNVFSLQVKGFQTPQAISINQSILYLPIRWWIVRTHSKYICIDGYYRLTPAIYTTLYHINKLRYLSHSRLHKSSRFCEVSVLVLRKWQKVLSVLVQNYVSIFLFKGRRVEPKTVICLFVYLYLYIN